MSTVNKLLQRFNIADETNISGMKVLSLAKAKNAQGRTRPNVFVATVQDASDTNAPTKKAYVGMKTLEEGFLTEVDENTIIVSDGYETYENNSGERWIRNKSKAPAALAALD